ncbi:MAG: hypothetical protein GXO21_04125 [Aquificae bacterium]|nr:hypothetical protein [Aquificota bacterium]
MSFTHSNASWGAGSFAYGFFCLALPKSRQKNFNFIANVVKHEAGHMFGIQQHCDEVQVEGYIYNPKCNMHYACETNHTCQKCLDYLGMFWHNGLLVG